MFIFKKFPLVALSLLIFISCQRVPKFTFERLQATKTEACSGDKHTFNIALDLELPILNRRNKGMVRYLMISLFEDSAAFVSNREVINRYIAKRYTEFEEMRVGHELLDYACRYEEIMSSKVLLQTEDLISYEVKNYTYAGGAHGISYTSLILFDVKSGNRMTEKSLFVEDYQERLNKLLECALLDSIHAHGYKSSDFWLDNISSNNFTITPAGLRFQFGTYEIAPYSFGAWSVCIPLDSLSTILRPQTCVSNFHKKQ
ncbi:MAG: DUF3298 domain-containing protein [Bacteroidales bacterium]